jgi:hypothetical protein
LKNIKPEETKIEKQKSDSKKGHKEDLAKLIKEGTILVYSIDFYPGMFRDHQDKIYDLRPNDEAVIRPSMQTFLNMEKAKLQKMLLEAY